MRVIQEVIQTWWYIPIMPAAQEDHQFKSSLGNSVSSYLKIKTKKGWKCSSVVEHPWVPSLVTLDQKKKTRSFIQCCTYFISPVCPVT